MNLHVAWIYESLVQYLRNRTAQLVNTGLAMTAPTQSALEATPEIAMRTLPVSNGLDVEYYSPGVASVDALKRFGIDSYKN